jgi:hypothetical protein
MIDLQWAFLLVAICSPIVAWWGTTRYFTGKVQQWIEANEQATRDWRDEVAARLQALEAHFRNTEQAVIATKVESITKEVWSLREWKHARGEPYVGAMDAMNQRVTRIERVLNGKL